MKILIVGAGVSGLATYLQLKKLLPPQVEILIYDAHASSSETQLSSLSLSDSTAVVGNSIILPPSSIRLLQRISPKLYDLFKSRGFENRAFTIRSARGHSLAKIATDDGSGEYSVSCPRWVLWECLREVVGQGHILHGRVVDVDLMSGDRPVVKFEDGRSSAVDLVVGADGVHSVVKRSIFGEADKSQYAPRFEGYRGVGAFLDMQEMPEIISKQRSVVVTFGSTGSFGYAAAAPLSQCRLGWWSNWPTAEPPISSYTDPNDVRQQLLERHATWKDPVIQRCILRSSTDRVYPLWTTPDLPHWGERGCVLLGDAAHTLQATSGQGAVQALEDSVTFSLLLAYHLSNKVGPDFASSVQVSEAVEAASKGLYELRHQRVRDIRARARNLYFGGRANRNIFWEYLYYCFLFVVTNFPTVGNWAIGSSFVEARDWEPDVEVSRYVDQHS